MEAERVTRKQKRLERNNRRNSNEPQRNSLNLKNIEPLTNNQKITFQQYNKQKNMVLIGSAGSGKTFMASYLAIKDVMENNDLYKKIYICRSAEPTKNVGFLPGSLKDKIKVYEAPYVGIFAELFGRGDAYELLKNKNMVEFISTSYIRGITLDNCIVIMEECQNSQFNELFTVMTRLGKDSKIIFAGDYKQSDLKAQFKGDEKKEDILNFIKIIKTMKSFAIVEFTHADIVRSGIVKEFIIAAENLGY